MSAAPAGRAGSATARPRAGRKPRTMTLSEGVLVKVRALLPDLAPAERRVADAVLADPAGTAMQSISDFARSCDTSSTTVMRFCRQLGLGGYPELRLALVAAVTGDASAAEATSDIQPNDSAAEVVKKIAYADAKAVEDTAANLDVEVLEKVVKALRTARRIDLYGVGASGYAAADMQQKLHRIGKLAFAWPDAPLGITSAALLGPGDVAVGLSHTGTTVDTIDALVEARKNGATTIAITNFPRSPITSVASLAIHTAARETAFRAGAMTSRIAQLTVVDCIFVLLARADPGKTKLALERTFAAAQTKRVRGGQWRAGEPARRRTHRPGQ